eukprot:365436-Chlamydomonas_euryale.AAC.12
MAEMQQAHVQDAAATRMRCSQAITKRQQNHDGDASGHAAVLAVQGEGGGRKSPHHSLPGVAALTHAPRSQPCCSPSASAA